VVHQATGADNAKPHTGRRPVAPGEDVVELPYPRPLVGDRNREDLRRLLPFDGKLHPAAARIRISVPDDLGDRCGDSRLLGGVEAERRGDLAGTLPGEDDVVLMGDADGKERVAHAASRATTTVTSSRPRL
jgi:hypothetical protein